MSGSLIHPPCMTAYTYKPAYHNVNIIILCAIVPWIITKDLNEDAMSVFKLLKAYT